MSSLNGHDRVRRYTNASIDDAAFRALVGDDMNGMIEAMQHLSESVSGLQRSLAAKMVGLQTSVIILLLGIIADIILRMR